MARRLLIAGFDFGTSFSKVVLQDQATKVKRAVSFPSEHPYLLPSAIGFDGDQIYPPCGEYQDCLVAYPKMLGSYVAEGRTGIRRLLHLSEATLERLDSEDRRQFTQRLLAWYFACVVRGVRSSISSDPDWGDFDFDGEDLWSIQMCVPTGLLHKGSKVEKFLREALCVGWMLHEVPDEKLREPISFGKWENACQSAERQLLDEARSKTVRNHCAVYPEVAAGVQSILRSPSALDGRYITMDVGAGTIDLNAFFRRSGQWFKDASRVEKGLDYYAVHVAPLGAARIEELQNHSPYGGAHTGNHEWGIEPMREAVLMKLVKSSVIELIEKALVYQENLGSEGQQTWDKDTYIYIWGGGANRRGYFVAFAEGLRAAGIGHPDVNPLPTPQDFIVPKGMDFGRFAIAYGLSFHVSNLERVALPEELQTFEQARAAAGAAEEEETTKDCTCGGLNPSCSLCGGRGYVVVRPKKQGSTFPTKKMGNGNARRQPSITANRPAAPSRPTPKKPSPSKKEPSHRNAKRSAKSLERRFQRQLSAISKSVQTWHRIETSASLPEKCRLASALAAQISDLPVAERDELRATASALQILRKVDGATEEMIVVGRFARDPDGELAYQEPMTLKGKFTVRDPEIEGDVGAVIARHPIGTKIRFIGRAQQGADGVFRIVIRDPEDHEISGTGQSEALRQPEPTEPHQLAPVEFGPVPIHYHSRTPNDALPYPNPEVLIPIPFHCDQSQGLSKAVLQLRKKNEEQLEMHRCHFLKAFLESDWLQRGADDAQTFVADCLKAIPHPFGDSIRFELQLGKSGLLARVFKEVNSRSPSEQ